MSERPQALRSQDLLYSPSTGFGEAVALEIPTSLCIFSDGFLLLESFATWNSYRFLSSSSVGPSIIPESPPQRLGVLTACYHAMLQSTWRGRSLDPSWLYPVSAVPIWEANRPCCLLSFLSMHRHEHRICLDGDAVGMFMAGCKWSESHHDAMIGPPGMHEIPKYHPVNNGESLANYLPWCFRGPSKSCRAFFPSAKIN